MKTSCLPMIRLMAISLLFETTSLAAEGAGAPGGTRPGVEALKARILGLEKSIATLEGTVSTAAAGEAGAMARAGAGDAAKVQALVALVQRLDGPGLAGEVGSLLALGETSHATLHDFCLELDKSSRQAQLLSYSYRLSFSLVHTAVLYPDELARFAHYFLAASHDLANSTLRRTLFDFLPDFLRYHRGRYADLERALEEEILKRLKEGKGSLQMYFSSMEALGYKPPIEVFDPLLEKASSHAEVLPVVQHLQSRNNPQAVAILSRNASKNPPGLDWKSGMMLSALARMSVPQAERSLWRFVYAANDNLRGTAVQAYFSIPRDESSLPMLRDFLNANVRLEQKRLVIVRLRQANPGIIDALKSDPARLHHEEVRNLLRDDPSRAAK